MNKDEHAKRLRAAMAANQVSRAGVSDATGKGSRTITNWTNGITLPDDQARAILRRMFPGYDDPGDPVEVSILNSDLTDDRRYSLLATYKRLVREQAEGMSSTP